MKSEFNGGLFESIGIGVVQFLICLCTLGLGAPWAVCLREKWCAQHTIIDGKQLVFDGKGGQLLGNYLKWFFLTIITLGIYSFWLSIKMKTLVVSHTHFAQERQEIGEGAEEN